MFDAVFFIYVIPDNERKKITMKQILLFFIAIAICFSSCDTTEKRQYAVLIGSLQNNTDSVLIFYFEDNSDTIQLSKKNDFRFQIDTKKPVYGYFRINKKTITVFLSPGDSVEMYADVNRLDEISFSGIGAEENIFLMKLLAQRSKNEINYEEWFSLEEKNFIQKSDSAYKAQLAYLEKLKKQFSKLNTNFINTEKARIFYVFAESRIAYERAQVYSASSNQKLSPSFYDFQKEINLNDSTMIFIPEYQIFLKTYLDKKLYEKGENYETMNDLIKAEFNIILSEMKQQKIKNYLLHSAFKDHLQFNGLDGVNDLLLLYEKHNTNKKNKEEINAIVKKWQQLLPGEAAPEIVLPDVEGKMYSLKDFKGKYVFIDFWATWCYPCRREIPYLAKLFKEFASKNIVFMSISIDKEKEAWMQMLKKEKMPWLQLHSTPNAKLLQDYQIYSIPRFVLIDKEGKIINAKAPAPSEKKLREILNRVL